MNEVVLAQSHTWA